MDIEQLAKSPQDGAALAKYDEIFDHFYLVQLDMGSVPIAGGTSRFNRLISRRQTCQVHPIRALPTLRHSFSSVDCTYVVDLDKRAPVLLGNPVMHGAAVALTYLEITAAIMHIDAALPSTSTHKTNDSVSRLHCGARDVVLPVLAY